ncbi:MAG: hypothetical protein J1E96_01555 [Ruminococcus sp.]|nr:hypothetical protein [Ruminococcus sp.]
MKKFTKILTTIFIVALISGSTLSANAATIGSRATGYDAPEQIIEQDEEDTLPSKYSSLELGHCTDVKRQVGNVCWAYAAISSFETALLKNNAFRFALSTNALDIWGTVREDGTGWQRDPLEAGFTYIPIGYFTSWGGPESENGESAGYGVSSLIYADRNNRSLIKKSIMNSGAVTANFNSFTRAYSQDNCSFALTSKIPSINGHTVSVVGWDDNYSKENFDGKYTPEEDGAWLCKNSWGPNDNRIGGYLWISYEDYYLFNDEFFGPSYMIEEMIEITEDRSIYQNEFYGATYEFQYVDDKDVIYFNVFDFAENGNVLEKVVFESTSVGAEYNVYYVPVDEDGAPVQATQRWQKLSGGTVDFSGYTCCDIDNKILSQTKGAIAVEINTEKINENVDKDNYVLNGIGVSEWLRSASDGELVFTDPCKRRQSFISYKGKFIDAKEFYKTYLDDDIGGTLVIKAITKGTFDTKLGGDVDFSGEVDISDATMIQKYLADVTLDLSDDQLTNADFNGDGEIDVIDVTAIQKYLAKVS